MKIKKERIDESFKRVMILKKKLNETSSLVQKETELVAVKEQLKQTEELLKVKSEEQPSKKKKKRKSKKY